MLLSGRHAGELAELVWKLRLKFAMKDLGQARPRALFLSLFLALALALVRSSMTEPWKVDPLLALDTRVLVIRGSPCVCLV